MPQAMAATYIGNQAPSNPPGPHRQQGIPPRDAISRRLDFIRDLLAAGMKCSLTLLSTPKNGRLVAPDDNGGTQLVKEDRHFESCARRTTSVCNFLRRKAGLALQNRSPLCREKLSARRQFGGWGAAVEDYFVNG
jgi:hypothetical protein